MKNISTNESSLLKINFQLPIPLSLNALNVIESHFFQNLLNEFYAKYEEYDLGNIFFTYWIAVNSNSITAAVHYGALIEKLQAKYMKIQNVSYSKILDKSVLFRKGGDKSILTILRLPNIRVILEGESNLIPAS